MFYRSLMVPIIISLLIPAALFTGHQRVAENITIIFATILLAATILKKYEN